MLRLKPMSNWAHRPKPFGNHCSNLMSSYSPSGGMKLMLRSESNLLRRTHWWKVQSSMAIDCFPLWEQRNKQTKTIIRKCKLFVLFFFLLLYGRNFKFLNFYYYYPSTTAHDQRQTARRALYRLMLKRKENTESLLGVWVMGYKTSRVGVGSEKQTSHSTTTTNTGMSVRATVHENCWIKMCFHYMCIVYLCVCWADRWWTLVSTVPSSP